MSVVSKKAALIEFLESIKPQHNKYEAVSHALLAARYGSGIGSRFSVAELIKRLDRYREISLTMACLCLEKGEFIKPTEETLDIARYRANQALEYTQVIERIRAYQQDKKTAE